MADMKSNRPNQLSVEQLEHALQHSATFPVKRVDMASGQAKEAYIGKASILEHAAKAKSIMAYGGYPNTKAVERIQIIQSNGLYMYSIEFGRTVFLP